MENNKFYNQTLDLVKLDLYHHHDVQREDIFNKSFEVKYIKGNEINLLPQEETFTGEKEIIVPCKVCGSSIKLRLKYAVIAILTSDILVKLLKSKNKTDQKVIRKILLTNVLLPIYLSPVLPLILLFAKDPPKNPLILKLIILAFWMAPLLGSLITYLTNRNKIKKYSAKIEIKNIRMSNYFKALQGIEIKTVIIDVEKAINKNSNLSDGELRVISEIFGSHELTDIKSEHDLSAEIMQYQKFPQWYGTIKYNGRKFKSTDFIIDPK
jgi:hypothetical protein